MRITKKQSSLLPAGIPLSSIPIGSPVWDVKAKKLIIKVKVTGFLLNSNIVADVINRGDCIVFSLDKSTLYVTEGSREVKPVTSELIWSEQ